MHCNSTKTVLIDGFLNQICKLICRDGAIRAYKSLHLINVGVKTYLKTGDNSTLFLPPEVRNQLRLLPSYLRFKLQISFKAVLSLGLPSNFLVYFPTFSKRVLIISTGHLALVSQTLRLPLHPKI